MSWWLSMLLLAANGGGDRASGPGADAESAELARLAGHRVERLPAGGYNILDVAGEGRPLVGWVEARGSELWLVGDHGALRLVGPLAQPRISGPGYKVWVLGQRAGTTLRARRIGVLAPPSEPRARSAATRRY